MAKENEYLDEAYNTLVKISADEQKRLEYEAREKALKDYEIQIQQKKNPVFFSKNIDLKQKTDYWNEKTNQ